MPATETRYLVGDKERITIPFKVGALPIVKQTESPSFKGKVAVTGDSTLGCKLEIIALGV